MTDGPTEPRFALPTTDLLDGYGVQQIALFKAGEVPKIIDIDTDLLSQDAGLLDVCREIKKRRLDGTLPPTELIHFHTEYANGDDPTPQLQWVYDRHALADRALCLPNTKFHTTVDVWTVPVQPIP